MQHWIHCFGAFCGACNELHSLWDITKKLVVGPLSILFKLSDKEENLPDVFHELSELAPDGCSPGERYGTNDIDWKLRGVHAHF